MLQKYLNHKIRWPFIIFEVPLSFATEMQGTISGYVRKWLGLHPNIATPSLYSDNSPCPLPLSSLETILKASKISTFLQLRDSRDPQIANSNLKLVTGQKWSVDEEVKNLETDISIQKVVGTVPVGRFLPNSSYWYKRAQKIYDQSVKRS